MEIKDIHLKLTSADINQALQRWLPENSFITQVQAVPQNGHFILSARTQQSIPLLAPKNSEINVTVDLTTSGHQILAQFSNLKLNQKSVPFEKQIISRLLQKMPMTAGIKATADQLILDANVLAGHWVQAAKLQVLRIRVTAKMLEVKLMGKITT